MCIDEELLHFHTPENPLLAIDFIVARFRTEKLKAIEKNKLRCLLLCTILSLAGDQTEIGTETEVQKQALRLLERRDDYRNKRLIAACFLRLIPEPEMKWLHEPPWRPKLISFFESQFSEDLYHDRKINPDMLAHEKIEKLSAIIREHDQNFRYSLKMLTSLDQINAQRKKLMGVINSKIGRILIRPFLPDELELQLGELYRRVETFIDQRDELGVVDAHSSVLTAIEHFVKLAEGTGAYCCQCLAEELGKRLLSLCEEDFAKNKAAQPATIVVEARDKKYPFHICGHFLNLGFTLKNDGPGYAYDIRLTIIGDDSIRLTEEQVEIDRLAPGTIHPIDVPAEVLKNQLQVDIALQAEWRNFDGTAHGRDFSFSVDGQKSDIDWEKLARSYPYSLEPVNTEQELAGRRDVLNRLIGSVCATNVGSSIIQGQKRVGKTSIAKAIDSYLQNSGFLVIYVESGDYVEPNPRATVARLGKRLCEEILFREPRVAHLQIPEFNEALSPLVDFLVPFYRIAPDRRIVIIIDEFDEIPLELYTRGLFGNAFFLTLRSISSRQQIGFILVGGEKMAHVLDCQGDQLNKWNVVNVDYFSRESDWMDYRELVQRPAGDSLEYSEEALIALHEVSAGNPYFTKLLCGNVLRAAVERRDCYITRIEVEEAIERTIRETDRNTFQHFWSDGIFERGENAQDKSIRRRKVLIAVSDAVSKQSPAPSNVVKENPLVIDLPTIDADLKEFVTRRVLNSIQNDTYEFKVPLFFKWLRGRGINDIITTFSDLDAVLRKRLREQEQKIQSTEIVELVKQWGVYRGQIITEDRVRAWLEQFGGPEEQRAMFMILKGIRFYTNEYIRKKMSEVHEIVRQGLVQRLEPGKLKRSDILIGYLDSPGKSGAQLARLYADQASIYVENVVEKGTLADKLNEKQVQAIVFVDDFVGTGESVSEYLKDLDKKISDVVIKNNIKVVFVAVVSYITGWQRIEESVSSLSMPVKTHVCEILDESTKLFSDHSIVFPDPKLRGFAKEIALSFGKLLEKNCPLGYGYLEMAVVFERGCPNNSLPILWSESPKQKWTALFKRR